MAVEGSRLDREPTGIELLAGLTLFIVPAVGYLLALIPLHPNFGFALLFILALGLLYGAWKGFPPWSLPYIGCVLSIFVFLNSIQYLNRVLHPHILTLVGPRPWSVLDRLFLQFVWDGIAWILLIVLTGLLLLVIALVPRLQHLLAQIRQDWTVFSFTLYGGTVFNLILIFDEYRHKAPLIISGMLILAAGAYFYLQGGTRRRKMLYLLAAVTGAMLVAAAGKWLILPFQDWGPYLDNHPPETERWFEALSTLITLGWMVLAILSPSILGLVYRNSTPSGTGQVAGDETEIPGKAADSVKQINWPGVTAGTLLFTFTGLVLILGAFPRTAAWVDQGLAAALHSLLFSGLILLPSIAFAVGLARGSPAWAYPYAGFAFFFSLYISSVSNPGLRLFVCQIFGRMLWSWRAWIPLLAALLAAVVLSRSLRPLARFFTNGWDDWTLFSFCLFGGMPLLIAVSFDEVDRLYSLYYMLFLTVFMTLTALFYLLSRTKLQRALTLVVGIFVILSLQVIGVADFWSDGTFQGVYLPGYIFIYALFLSPALIPLIRRRYNKKDLAANHT